MGLDVGQRNIGVALSDPAGRMAYGWETVRRTRLPKDLDRIAEIAREQEVEMVVIGLPRSLDGTLGPQAERVQRFGNLLAQRISVPIEYWDERLTTVAAERAMREAGLSAHERRQRIDAAAATLILDGYLEYQRNVEQRDEAQKNEQL